MGTVNVAATGCRFRMDEMHFDDTNARLQAIMFADGNRIRFERPVDEKARAWWLEDIYDKRGLTPEDVGDLVTRSIQTEKSIIYRRIDGGAQEFALRVEGRLQDAGELWFVDRTISISGALFNADEMFVPDRNQMGSIGSGLMADLIETGKLLEANRIMISAQKIGRYAWLRMGFKPDEGSWRAMKGPLASWLSDVRLELGDPRIMDLTMQIMNGRPDTAVTLANLRDLVPSRYLKDDTKKPAKVPLGRRFFLEQAGDWTGEFDLTNRALVERALAYGRRGRRT